jgi:hypothetical protein
MPKITFEEQSDTVDDGDFLTDGETVLFVFENGDGDTLLIDLTTSDVVAEIGEDHDYLTIEEAISGHSLTKVTNPFTIYP